MTKLFAALTTAVLTLSSNPAIAKAKVAGNAVSVTVEDEQDVARAYAAADEFCGKYGKLARRTGGGGYTYIFDCVVADVPPGIGRGPFVKPGAP